MLEPAPGRCVVKMHPISKYVDSGIVTANGMKILKSEETVEREEILNSWAQVAKIAWREDDVQWFKEGDDVLISRLGGTRFELRDEDAVHVFWLLPVECVQGVDRD